MGTFEALAVAVIAVLPGGFYSWAYESRLGRWGVGLADRLTRFAATSLVLHLLAAPLTYAIYTDHVRSGALARGDAPLWLWPVAAGYVAVPGIAGLVVATGVRRGWPWARLLTGPAPAPRAWDYFFSSRPAGFVRLRLKSKVWLAGTLEEVPGGRRSYAAGYPDPQDLYLVRTLDIDAETGVVALAGPVGAQRPVLLDVGLLVRWDEVEYLEFVEGDAA